MWSRFVLRRCRQAWMLAQLIGILAAMAACAVVVYDHVELMRQCRFWQQQAQAATAGWQRVTDERAGCEARVAAAHVAQAEAAVSARDQLAVLTARAAGYEAAIAGWPAYCRSHPREGACRLLCSQDGR